MKLDVPFYESQTDTDCGPLALKMVLAYFGKKYTFDEIAKLERRLESGMVWTLGIACAAAKLGFPAKFSTTSYDEPAESDLEFYKKHADNEAMLRLRDLQKDVEEHNVRVEQRALTMDELLSSVTEQSVPIVLLDWSKVSSTGNGFQGHIVPVTGYDDENIYVHNPGVRDAKAHYSIKRKKFITAWTAKGTDQDAVIVSRNMAQEDTLH